MVEVLQLLHIGPAVTPEDVCVLRHVLQHVHHPAAIVDRAVRLQLSILVVTEPYEIWRLWDFIALDKEEFGFCCQSRAGVRHEHLTDGVQVEFHAAIRISAEQPGWVGTADDAADEGVHAVMLNLSGDVLQARKDFIDAQQHVKAHAEVKARK